jgi:hypothetical protein
MCRCTRSRFRCRHITCLDITTLETFDSNVKPFIIMIVFYTFDELMLHNDVCSLSFSEIHTWIKRVLNTHGRHGGPKKSIGDQAQYSQHPPPSHHVTFGLRKERDPIQHVSGLDSDCRIAATSNGHHDFIRSLF